MRHKVYFANSSDLFRWLSSLDVVGEVHVVSRCIASTYVGVGGRPRKSLIIKHLRGGRGKQKACQPCGWHGDCLVEPNRIRRSVTLAPLGFHDLIDGGIGARDILHDNLLAPVRASVELHHHRHRCCFNFHAVSIAAKREERNRILKVFSERF